MNYGLLVMRVYVLCPRLRSRTKIIFVHKIFGKILDKGGIDIVHLWTKFFIMGMLEYSKKILTKMSFDADLFRKELKKCLGYLTPQDAKILRKWANANYGDLVVA